MTSRLIPLAAVLALALGSPRAASDEAQLRERAALFYQLQIAGKRVEASKLVAPDSRPDFLNGRSLPLTAVRVERVTLTSKGSAEVEVNAEMMLPLFSAPVSRTFPTPWKKVRGKWYFVVDMSAVREVMSRNDATQSAGASEPLAAAAPAPFGSNAEIRRTIRIENRSAGAIRFKVIPADEDWLDLLNAKGDIPAGESFPIVVVLKQLPRESQSLTLRIEGVQEDGRIVQVSVPIQLEPPGDSGMRNALQQAIRKHRAEQ